MRRHLIMLAVLLCVLVVPVQVRAEYFDRHHDWTEYCMQARDIRVTAGELKKWSDEGKLKDKIITRSEVSARKFTGSDAEKNWTNYRGTYDVDISGIPASGFHTGSEYQATIYLDKNEPGWNYIQIQLIVGPEGTKGDGEDGTQERTKSIGTMDSAAEGTKGLGQESTVTVVTRVFQTASGAAVIFLIPILYPDVKVLNKYRRKLNSKGEHLGWRY